jgi:hypothetical protein
VAANFKMPMLKDMTPSDFNTLFTRISWLWVWYSIICSLAPAGQLFEFITFKLTGPAAAKSAATPGYVAYSAGPNVSEPGSGRRGEKNPAMAEIKVNDNANIG